jgi:2'-5' RNA ligase
MKKRLKIYWLVPAKPEYELFRELIRILAKEFDAPLFEPHLTIGKASGGHSPAKLLREIRAAPVRLRIGEIAHSSKFTKTLFVRFTAGKSLERVVARLGGNSKSLRDPHLSLLYKRLPARTRRELAAAIKLPFSEVKFDVIKAVSCVSPTETRSDVESWRKLATKQLSG